MVGGGLCLGGEGEKMKSTQRNPFAPPCHCSGVARSDSKISAKALYGKEILSLLTLNVLDFTSERMVL